MKKPREADLFRMEALLIKGSHIPEIIRFFVGKAYERPQFDPVSNAKAGRQRVVEKSSGGHVAVVEAALRKEGRGSFTSQDTKRILRADGRSSDASGYVLNELLKRKLAKRLGVGRYTFFPGKGGSK